MEVVKIRIEPITPKEAIERDERLLEFLTDEKRIQENSWASNYRHNLDEANDIINEIKPMFFT